MTKLESIYGIKVTIDDNLEAFTINVLKERAFMLSMAKGIDLNDFNIYYHTITIENQPRAKHLSKHYSIQERIQMLDLIFQVNQKQRLKNSIMFFNFLVNDKNAMGSSESGGRYRLVNRFTGKEIEDNKLLKTELITFVRSSEIRQRHKKIKVSFTPQPTTVYSTHLRNNSDFNPSDFDIPLTQEIRVQINQTAGSNADLETIFFKKEHKDFINALMRSDDKQIVLYLTQTVNKMEKQENNIATGGAQVGVQGSGAKDNSIDQKLIFGSQLPEGFDYDTLSKQINDVKDRLQKNKDENNDEHLDAISNIIKAGNAAKLKEGSKVVNFLKNAGEWVRAAAIEVGAKLVSEIIVKNAGL